MQANYGKTTSVWMDETDVPRFDALSRNLETEVCVVGAGIAGLSTAYLLAQEGKSVVLLEAGGIGRGETSRTTAHLSDALDDRYYELERLFGEDGSAGARQSHSQAVDLIESIVNKRNIDCDFTRVDGFLFVAPGQPPDDLDRELEAAQRAGVAGVAKIARAPIDFNTGSCLRFPHQAQFHPLKYLNGLANAFIDLGGRIFTRTRVEKVRGGSNPRAETFNGKTVRSEAIVLATNSPIDDNLTIHARQAPYRSYVIAAAIPWDAVPRALYWDTGDPYHYARLKSARTPEDRGGYDTLIVGGEDHKQGESDDGDARFASLEKWARARFPIEEVTSQWSGMVCEPADSLAFLGRDNAEENVYIATGDSGHGITHGTIAGMLITDLICNRQNRWTSLYNPSRVTARAVGQYLKENADVAAEMLDWVTPGEVKSDDLIAPGSGKVVRRGLGKIAVFRDDQGRLHECSAVCPHLGCIVSWNSTEQSWDCPCHGSRFDADGKMLRGPATHDLEKAE